MKRPAAVDCETLAAEIADLSKLGIDDLRERWKAVYGKAPSSEIGRSFLTRSIAYRLQEQIYGGLKPSTRRLLAEAAGEAARGNSPKTPQIRKTQSGTILVREWQGNAHRVTNSTTESHSTGSTIVRSPKWHARLPAVGGPGRGSSG